MLAAIAFNLTRAVDALASAVHADSDHDYTLDPDEPANLSQLDRLEPTLAALVLAHERLRLVQASATSLWLRPAPPAIHGANGTKCAARQLQYRKFLPEFDGS